MNNSGAICNVNSTYLAIHSFTIRMEICISTVRTDPDSQAFQRTPVTQVKDLSLSGVRWRQGNGQKDYLYFISTPIFFSRLKHWYICHRLTSDLHWQL